MTAAARASTGDPMMRIANWAFGLSILLLAALPAYAADRGTPDEAKALAEKAAVHFKDVGVDKAIADFVKPDGGYVDRDLFVVVYSPDNKVMASYGIPALQGKDATTMKDTDGKEFGKAIIAAGKSGTPGWVEYRMTNPLTKKIEAKRSYVIQVGDYVVFVGAYAS
jgi:cytochrome c